MNLKIYPSFFNTLVKKTKKFFGLLLTFTMLITSVPVGPIFAKDEDNQNNSNNHKSDVEFDMAAVPIDFELKDKRDKYTKSFRKIDGTYEVSVYDEPVHYLNGDTWVQIDNSLVFDEKVNEYENKANSYKIKLPKTIKENKDFKLRTDDYTFDWNILGINDSDINIIEGEENNSNNLRIAENVNQRVIYNNIFKNVDLEYIVKGEAVKENIILNEYKENFAVSMELKVKDLTLMQDEDSYVFVNEDDEVVFDLGSYYMIDDQYNISKDIDVSIEEISNDKYLLTITPSDEWLSDANRAYPVILDPTVTIISDGNSLIKDKYVGQVTGVSNSDYLAVGKFTSSELNRSYFGLELDKLLEDKPVITYARLELNEYGNDNTCNLLACKVIVREVVNSSYDSISSYPYPETNSKIIDYNYTGYVNDPFDEFDYYEGNNTFSWDITKLIQKWKSENKVSGTLELSMYNESLEGRVHFDSLEYANGIKPKLIIGYVETSGINDYWTYHNQSAGEAGNGYTNDYTGNLTYVFTDYMPVGEWFTFGIKHIYDLDNKNVNIGYGSGWRLNYSETIKPDDADLGMYVYTDGDGSQTYYNEVDCSDLEMTEYSLCYLAEDGSSDVFGIDSQGNKYITTSEGIEKLFITDANGISKLSKITDTTSNRSITINYQDNTEKITSITDDKGNRADFHYLYNLLDSIEIKRINSYNYQLTLEETIEYDYLGNRLSKMRHVPIEREYEKQWLDPQGGYNLVNTDIFDGLESYFTTPQSSRTVETASYVFKYGATTPQYSYVYEKYEWYDKVCFQQYQNDTSFGGDWNYLDEKIGSEFCRYFDNSSSSDVGADNNYDRYEGVSGFSSTSDSTLSTYNYPDKEDVKNTDNAYYYKVISRSANYKKDPNCTIGTVTWSSTTRSDGTSGDYYYNYSPRYVSYTDAYGNPQSASVRHVTTVISAQKKVYYEVWKDQGEFQYSKTTPPPSDTPEGEFRWVPTGNVKSGTAESENIFTYDEYDSNRLIGVKNTLDNGLTYYYNSNNQVERIEEYNKDGATRKLVSSMDIDYEYKLTKFTDFRGNTVRYTFDNYGHTINVLDSFGNAVYYEYENIFNNQVVDVNNVNYNMNHKVLQVSLPQKSMLDPDVHGYIDSRENLVKNPSFESPVDGTDWQITNATRVSNGSTDVYNDVLGDSSILINGNTSTAKIIQTIEKSGSAGDSFVFGGWTKAEATPYNNYTTKEFYIKVTVDSVNGTDEVYILHLNPNVEEWQYLMSSFITQSDYNKLTFEVYYNNVNTAYFDGLQLYEDAFGTSYTYNDKALNDASSGYVDKTGTVSEIKSPAFDKVMHYSYDPYDPYVVTSVSDEEGNTYNFNYTDRKLSSISDDNFDASFSYNSDGNLEIVTSGDKTGEWSSMAMYYEYTQQFVERTTNEFNETIEYETDLVTGLLQAVIDQSDVRTDYEYDSYGRLVRVSKSNSENIYYYINGRLDEIEVNGFNYRFVYDSFGRVTSVLVDEKPLMSYEYEVYNDGTNDYYTGRIITQTYSNNDSIKFRYNDEGQTTAIQYKVNDVYQDLFLYEYDHMNNLAKFTDKTDVSDIKTYSYIYDVIGRVRSVVDNIGNNVSYTYDDDNLSEFKIDIDGFNRTVKYNYNTTNDLYDKTVYSANGNDITKQYVYKANDDLKRLEKITLNTGSTIINQSFTYDDSRVYSSYGNATTRLRSISYDIVDGTSYTYSYDEKGNITYIEVKDGSTIVEKYNYYYDDLNQLVREDIYTTTNEYTMVYDYDNYGNILSKKKYAYLNTSGTVLDELDYNYQTNGWNDQLIEFDGKTIEYDLLGNPTKIIDKLDTSNYVSLSWEGRQLIKYEVYEANVLKETITYRYNDQGIRTYKKVATDASNYDEYFYYLEGDAVLYEEINHVVGGQTSTDKIYYTYDIDGKLISINLNGTEYFYIRNMQGDITKIVDKDGNIVVSYTYDAWGNIIDTKEYKYVDGVREEKEVLDLAKLNPYRYRGYRYDEETSYYYLNSRYYNPEMGRFINADGLIGETGELLAHNMYSYCQNNPVMMVDPSGYIPVILVAVIGGAVVGGGSQIIANLICGKPWHKGVLAATASGAILPLIAMSLPGIAFLSPIIAGLAYAEINQYQYNGLENWSWNEFGIDFTFDTIGNYTGGLLPTKNINSAWVRNLKFNNIIKNLRSGKVVGYILKNNAIDLAGSTSYNIASNKGSEIWEDIKQQFKNIKESIEDVF